jgi:hypothetical protein
VDDAARIDVVDGDFFGTGKVYHIASEQGSRVLVGHTWELHANSVEMQSCS